MTWKNAIKKREDDRSDVNVKRFEAALSNFRSEYNQVYNNATKILLKAEKGEFYTNPFWQNQFKVFEEMVEGLKINMNRLTRMSDTEEEEMYRRMRNEDI